MIKINGNEYRNLPQQVAKNANDIEAITKDKTVTIYTHILTNDVDPNIHSKFSGTITLIGNVVIAVNGVVIAENTTYPVVAFNQINSVSKVMRITGYNNQLIDVDTQDFNDMNQYKLYQEVLI